MITALEKQNLVQLVYSKYQIWTNKMVHIKYMRPTVNPP